MQSYLFYKTFSKMTHLNTETQRIEILVLIGHRGINLKQGKFLQKLAYCQLELGS
jgi:hypothetical protein